MNNKYEFRLNIGLPSILLIFVVMCIISFAILSLAGAHSDKRLSQKIYDRSTAYYKACNLAEEKLASLDNELKNYYKVSNSEIDYYSQTSILETQYLFEITDKQSLQLIIEAHYPDNKDSALYKVVSWKTINTDTYDYDESLHVIPDF